MKDLIEYRLTMCVRDRYKQISTKKSSVAQMQTLKRRQGN